jgi:hypothetical protein
MIKETIKKFRFLRIKLSHGIIIPIIVLLLVALAFFSVFILFPYQRQKSLVDCLFKARKDYYDQWNTTCLSLYSKQVIQRYGADKLCASMAAGYADPIIANYHSQIDDCLNRFPQ